MDKKYCDVCKKEVTQDGSTFTSIPNQKVTFTLTAKNSDEAKKDLCLACAIKAVNAAASFKLKRPYTKKAVQPKSE